MSETKRISGKVANAGAAIETGTAYVVKVLCPVWDDAWMR